MSRLVALLLVFALFASTFAAPVPHHEKNAGKKSEKYEENVEGDEQYYSEAKADEGSIGAVHVEGGEFGVGSFSIGHGGDSGDDGDGGHGGNIGTNSYGGQGGDSGHTSYGG